MINIHSLVPPVNTPARSVTKRGEIAVTGAEVNKDAPQTQYVYQKKREHRKGRDRRQRDLPPLIDMRSGGDRRNDPDKPSINVKV